MRPNRKSQNRHEGIEIVNQVQQTILNRSSSISNPLFNNNQPSSFISNNLFAINQSSLISNHVFNIDQSLSSISNQPITTNQSLTRITHATTKSTKNSKENTPLPLEVRLLNIRSLFNKVSLLGNLITLEKIDLFFLMETWLHPMISDSMIRISNFEVIRSDRTSARGGGVALYYKDTLKITKLNDPVLPPKNSNFEFIAVQYAAFNTKLTFVCFYIPPIASKCSLTIANVCKVIATYITSSNPFILLGDFNLPKINWETSSSEGCSSEYFLQFCIEQGLSQIVSSPTHRDGNILDLMLFNASALSILITHSVECPLSLSGDHNVLSLSLATARQSLNTTSRSYFDFKNADYTAINQYLSSVDWSFLVDQRLSQQLYDRFIFYLQQAISYYTPTKTTTNNRISKLPKHIKKLLNVKLNTYKKLKVKKCSREEYKIKCQEYEAAVRNWHGRVEENICNNPNRSRVFSYANNKLNNKFILPTLLDSQGDSVSCNKNKADLLNETFYSSFSADDNATFNTFPKVSSFMPNIEISESDVLTAVKMTKDKLSLTPEKIPPYFIKRTIYSILHPLTHIFRSSLEFNFIPYQWKQSIITPIFKKGDRRIPINYRPVALTSSFVRIKESIISKDIIDHSINNNLLLPNQFGFLPNHSSSSQLLWCLDKWLKSYCSDEISYVIYTDVSKAFDTVNHRKLISILNSLGINDNLLKWIYNFLTNRSQKVRVGSDYSLPLPVISGIPQGSVLGPLLFLIFINDIVFPIHNQFNTEVALYADDTKIFSTNPAELQMSINLFDKVLQYYQLHLAPHKCFVLPISKPKMSPDQQFQIGSSVLEYSSSSNDLGIIICKDLKWESHVSKIVKNASFTSYQILKSFRSRNIWILVKLYKSYVRPKLEYNTSVWSPSLQQDIDKIEKVQHRYTKSICRRCNIPFSCYEDRLLKLNLISLEDRRIRYDLINLFKIANNLSDLDFNSFFSFQNNSHNLRRQTITPKFYAKNKTWHGSFFERATRYWNRLDPNIKATKSLEVFKNNLKLINYKLLKTVY